MATVIINEKSKQAKAIIAMLKAFNFVTFVSKEDSPYNPEFVEMVKKSAKEKGGRVVKAETLWQDLGL